MPWFIGASALSLCAWFIVFGAVVSPRIEHLGRSERLSLLLAPQCFRHISILLLMPGFTAETIPPHWVMGTIGGDVVTAILAMVTILLLRRNHPHAYKLAWLATIVGTADLLRNVIYAMYLEVPSHMLIAAAIPTMGVPLMLVAHIYALRVLTEGQ